MVIRKNQVNNVVLTLSEKQTQAQHDWLFEFTCEQAGEKKYCTAQDISDFPDRYNEFIITDDATEDQYNGQLNFDPAGSWSYNVYEMPVVSPPSLDPNDALMMVESGSVTVYDPDAEGPAIFNEDENRDNAVFED